MIRGRRTIGGPPDPPPRPPAIRIRRPELIEYFRPHLILSSSEISDRFYGLYSLHPHLCTLISSQELYGLPTSGSSNKDYSHDHVDCRNGDREGAWYQDGNGHGSVKEGY